ncbi:MAG: hypothetical protein IJD40_05565 [Lachnospiraceae bacterium]|nr:hypothetical protein [Lachnospiraceae bacterium]
MEEKVKNEYEFHEEWLELEKYQFKIMTVITVLADNNRAFRGKLSDLCKEMSIQASGGNTQKIRSTLDCLCEQGYLTIMKDEDIYNISLKRAAEKSKKVTIIKKAWYDLIKETKSNREIEAAWENLLKVFVVLLDYTEQNNDDLHTYKEIAKRIGASTTTIGRCVDAICSIDFVDFQIMRDVVNVANKQGQIKGKGQHYFRGMIFK